MERKFQLKRKDCPTLEEKALMQIVEEDGTDYELVDVKEPKTEKYLFTVGYYRIMPNKEPPARLGQYVLARVMPFYDKARQDFMAVRAAKSMGAVERKEALLVLARKMDFAKNLIKKWKNV